MKMFEVVLGLAATLLVGACQNITIDFDKLPDGTVLQAWDGTPGPIPSSVVISNQYSTRGAEFSSAGGGVFLLPNANPSSPPNVACPFAPGGLLAYSEPTTIRLGRSTCNVWVTIPPGLGQVTVEVFDASGTLLGSETTTGPNASPADGGGIRVRVNKCDARSVRLSGSNYCFDDFTWQKRLF